MTTSYLSDISLQDYTLDDVPRLRSLREQVVNAETEICIERARYVTEYLRDKSDEQTPPMLRNASAVNHFLNQKKPFFPDDNLLAGTTTSKYFGAPVYPEWTGLTIWPELDTISDRKMNPQKLTANEIEELNFDIFPYWMERNILERTRAKYNNPQRMRLFERIVFFLASKAGTISHTVPNYREVLAYGVDHIIAAARTLEEILRQHQDETSQQQVLFYQSVQVVLQGFKTYAANLRQEALRLAASEGDPERKENLKVMADVCAQVPAGPARNFREAVNAIWLIQIAIHAENINMAISPGRLDQVLFPYYEKGMKEGNLSIAEVIELTGCLWLKLNDNTNLVPETAEELFGGAGTVPAVTLGGVDSEGEDAVNDLTYILLRVTELLKLRDPSVNARYHYEKNQEVYRDRVSSVIAETKSVPAFHNDVADIKTLQNQGLSLEHARDYAIIGCVELASAGRSYDSSGSIVFNLVSALELTLYDGKRPVTGDEQIGPKTGTADNFKSFNDFWEAFRAQVEFLVGEAVTLNNDFGRVYQEYLPSPLLSAFFEGPLEKGQDLIHGGAIYNSSGATHIGFADTVDSLNAIERAVFIDKKCTFSELITALQSDFVGSETLQAYLINRVPKYGTDDFIAIKNSQNLVQFLYDLYQGRSNYRGGRYRPAYWSMTNHAGQGKLTGALPNGRKAQQVFASGITPVSQAADELTTCLQAVGGLGSTFIPGGEAFNLKYPVIGNRNDLKKFSYAVEAYMRSGGMHIQFNIMSYRMLQEAREHPERYPDLLVRVSGYSAYFRDLNEAMQEEILTRTAYDLNGGHAIPIPPVEPVRVQHSLGGDHG